MMIFQFRSLTGDAGGPGAALLKMLEGSGTSQRALFTSKATLLNSDQVKRSGEPSHLLFTPVPLEDLSET